MSKKIRMMLGLLSLLLVLFGLNQKANAEEMNFSWEVKQPASQRDKTKTYFDLRVAPGAQENLEVMLKNTSSKEITVQVEANTAVTNENGVIDYGITDPVFDKTLEHPFSEIAKTDPEVKLAANESKTITIKVAVPTEPFEGIILGGIRLSEKDEEKGKDEQSGVQIENKFAVVIGVRLSENDDPIEADMQLLGVKAGQRNYRNVILANLQNPMPRILNGITVDASVYAASNLEQPVYHSKQENLQMAPNSNFEYGITMNNKAFKAGKYVLQMTAKSGSDVWSFEQEFEIKADEAKKYNEEAVELAEEPTDYMLYYILAAIVVLILIALIVFISYKKHKNAEKKKKSSKSSKKRKRK